MRNPELDPPRHRRTRGLDVPLVVLAFVLLALAMAVLLYLTSQPPAYDSSQVGQGAIGTGCWVGGQVEVVPTLRDHGHQHSGSGPCGIDRCAGW
jgi:hypothetical protein